MSSRLPIRRFTARLALPRPSSAILFQTRTYAHANTKEPSGDYGSGAGDPKGGKPQEQGANPSASMEHPGPAAPKAGEGSGGATKSHADGHNTSEAKQGGQKRGFATYSAARFSGGASVAAKKGEDRPKTTEGLSPKIHKEDPPAKADQADDVKKHNREMEGRADKAHEGFKAEGEGDQTVGKGFWHGDAGGHQEKR